MSMRGRCIGETMAASLHSQGEGEHPLGPRLRGAARLIGLAVALLGLLRLALAPDSFVLPSAYGGLFQLFAGLSLYLQVPLPASAGRRLLAKLLGAAAGAAVLAGGTIAARGGALPMMTTAIGVAVALSLLLLGRLGTLGRLGWLASIAVLAYTLFVLIEDLYTFSYFTANTTLAVVTATANAALAAGVLLANPAYSPMRPLASNGPGGFITRRLLLPAIGLTLALHWLLRLASRSGQLDLSLGYSLTTCALVVSLAAVICYEGRILDRVAFQSQRRLTEAQTKLRLAMDIASVGYWEKDLRRQTIYYSPEWKRLLGYSDDEIANDREEWLGRLHPDDRDLVRARLKALKSASVEDYSLEFRLRHKDGDYRWISSRAVLSRDDNGTPVRIHGVHVDITERKEVEERIRQISQHDPLTGLPNRALIHEFAESFLATARRGRRQVAVLFVDLDEFKPINDEHGHEAGDEVLKEVARRLRASVRESDLVGRLGGDEFLIVLADVQSEAAAARVARVCLRRVDRPYTFRGKSLCTTPSIGIALFPRDGGDVDTLIRHADAAMYRAKSEGRNTFRFYEPGQSAPTDQAERAQ